MNNPFLAYILHRKLPLDSTEAKRIMRRSKAFTVINDELYRRSISGVLQRCIDPEDGKAILLDIHAGTCGHHAGHRALVAKAFRAGFYWPTAMQDADDMVKRCLGCQKFANKPHAKVAAVTMHDAHYTRGLRNEIITFAQISRRTVKSGSILTVWDRWK